MYYYNRVNFIKQFIFELYQENDLMAFDLLMEDLESIDYENLSNLHGGFWELLFGEN